MQCPACSHEASLEQFGDPAKCPQCGVYYEKALALKIRKEQPQAASMPPDQPLQKEKLKSAWSGAKLSVEEGRRRRAEREAEVALRRSPDLANGVVVVDIKMGFWSMVIFMVKWVIAAIPALIILIFLGVAVVSFFAGFAGSYTKYLSGSAQSPKQEAAAAPASSLERIHATNSASAIFWLIDVTPIGHLTEATVRTDEGGTQLYSRFSMDCENGIGTILSASSRIDELRTISPDRPYERITPDTPRHAIAKRVCRDRPNTHLSLK